ncbi:MAG: crossover junction endodeoxyribonuclease RuvC [Clostridia bacterium]|nr:crossover junction endodeoxyribonuclease RuvC [Clostridia bacterium]
MVILGLDPGFATIGFGVIESDGRGAKAVDYGTITTPKEKTFPERLVMIERGVKKLIEKFSPDMIAVEELFFNTNITTGINVAHARGVIVMTCERELPGRLYEYTPLQIKQALTGYGRADKIQMMQMVKTLLHLDKVPRQDDAADALAVALCHSQTSRLGGLFKMQ